MGIPNHLTCLLRNLYAGQETTVRTGHGTDQFQIGEKSLSRLYIVTLLFNFYAEYIMRNAGLDEAQTGIKIAGRNINNLSYGDDWRRQWHPTPVLLPGNSHRRRSLVGCSLWGRKESDRTERLHFHFSLSCIREGNEIHSSVLAWRIPGTGSLVGCRLWGRTESDMTEET